MGTKVVVGADGIAHEVPTTPQDDAQAAIDAAAWEAQQKVAAEQAAVTPVDKLKAFLDANPDVKALLGS